MTPHRGITGLFFFICKSYSRPPTHAPSSRHSRPDIVGVQGTFLYRASEFDSPLLRGSKCIPPLFSSPKGREWNTLCRTVSVALFEARAHPITRTRTHAFRLRHTEKHVVSHARAHGLCENVRGIQDPSGRVGVEEGRGTRRGTRGGFRVRPSGSFPSHSLQDEGTNTNSPRGAHRRGKGLATNHVVDVPTVN